MERDWDGRAQENAKHYFATSRQSWDDESFFASGEEEVRAYVLADLPTICGDRAPDTMTVLEIGCGAGRMTRALSKVFAGVIAVDVSNEMIRQARQALPDRTNIRWIKNNGYDLAMLDDECIDFAFSSVVFQHIPKRAIIASYFLETHRVLRPGSVFKCQVQGTVIPEDRADTWVGVGFRADEVAELARSSGFDVVHVTGANSQYLWLTLRKPLEASPSK